MKPIGICLRYFGAALLFPGGIIFALGDWLIERSAKKRLGRPLVLKEELQAQRD